MSNWPIKHYYQQQRHSFKLPIHFFASTLVLGDKQCEKQAEMCNYSIR